MPALEDNQACSAGLTFERALAPLLGLRLAVRGARGRAGQPRNGWRPFVIGVSERNTPAPTALCRGGRMEFKLEAHRIVSISLGKIYNSRVQRGAGCPAPGSTPLKKPRRNLEQPPSGGEDDDAEEMETGNVANLISIFGSSFSGLLRKSPGGGREEEEGEESGPEAAEPGQICCDKPVLRDMNPWSTAIVAF
ncbi:PREDICTED: immediate early response gene 5 protein [Mandrillus leucophaeus]|uniref:immediate early response gene 5 protein n=1 Tax=Mandrillus leucophaeus TaxID=9568 RepID=UPI0005F47883|nr:PREDICTED: immediate early response gene 5 protein [Mandrillus leucophaeus]